MNRGFSPRGILRSAIFAEQIPKEPIPQLTRRRFHTDAFLRRALGNVIAVNMKLQIMLTRQACDELLIRIRLRRAQFVIEMNDRDNHAELRAQLQQEPQERNRIDPAGDSDADAISSPQQFMPSNMRKHALRQGMHADMVPQHFGQA